MRKRIITMLVVGTLSLAWAPATAEHKPQECHPLIILGLPAPPPGVRIDCPRAPGEHPKPNPISGNAYGVHVKNVAVLGSPVATPPALPSVTLPPGGGPAMTANLFGTTIGPVSAEVMAVSTEGFPGQYSLSSAHTARVGFTLGALTLEATGVRAVAYCRADGFDDLGPFNDAGNPADPATLASLTFDVGSGPVTISGLPQPNTWIPLPGIGGIMLREQWDQGDNFGYQHFTENMIHVYLLSGPVTGEVIISSAHCDGYTHEWKHVRGGKQGTHIQIEF